MKTFQELSIGDYVYYIDDNNRIISLRLEGIRNVDLKGTEFQLYIVGGRDLWVIPDKEKCYDRARSLEIHASQESAQAVRKANKDSFVARQCRIALGALRKIKACDHNLAKSQDRLRQLFQMLEEK